MSKFFLKKLIILLLLTICIKNNSIAMDYNDHFQEKTSFYTVKNPNLHARAQCLHQEGCLNCEPEISSVTTVHIKEGVEVKTPLIKRDNGNIEMCEDCDIQYWGFTQWLFLGAKYVGWRRGGEMCDGSDGHDISLKILCCPLATAGWLICAPFSCLACCCFCPQRTDEGMIAIKYKEAEAILEQQRIAFASALKQENQERIERGDSFEKDW